jgi:transcription elongation factor/antiterminator RfaH
MKWIDTPSNMCGGRRGNTASFYIVLPPKPGAKEMWVETGACDPESGAVNGVMQHGSSTLSFAEEPHPHWYAIQTRSRHEKVVAKQLQSRAITIFLPLITEIHRWSDRRKVVEVPLFSSYIFVQLTTTNDARARVLHTKGVVRFVGQHAGGTPIPPEQIESVRRLLAQKIPCVSHPFLKAGQRVRIRGGALDGVEGVFQARSGDDTLVVSVEAIQRSLAVRITGYSVEVV